MPNTKITDLTDGDPAQTGDEIPVNRGGLDRKISVGSIATLATGAHEVLTGDRTLYVRTDPVVVTMTIASPAVVSWTLHGLSADDPVVFSLPYDRGEFTVTIASPAVVTKIGHGLAADDPIIFRSTGALPTGITAGTTYYVLATGLAADSFQFSASVAGAAVDTSGTQSGTHFLERNSSLPTGVTAGTVYYVLAAGLTGNTFQFSTAPAGAAVNTSGTQAGKIWAQTGNDANDGSAATVANALLTPQAAANLIGGYDFNAILDINVVIQLASGKYVGGVDLPELINGYNIDNNYANAFFLGDPLNPSNVVLTQTIAAGGPNSIWWVEGFRIERPNAGAGVFAGYRSTIYISNMFFLGGVAIDCLHAFDSGLIFGDITNPNGRQFTIQGAIRRFNRCSYMAIQDTLFDDLYLINIPSWSVAFSDTFEQSLTYLNIGTTHGTGTGKRFAVSDSSFHQSYTGGDLNHLPGNVAGTLTTGGVYDTYMGADTLNVLTELTVPDEVYGVGWDSDLSVPTKNSVYDKIESMSGSLPSDPGADRVLLWDETDNTVKWLQLANIATEGTPATGDYVLVQRAEDDLVKVDWSSLPGAGGGISNVVEDVTPQLGGDLDANTFDILFDDGTGIYDEAGNGQLLFKTFPSAVAYVELENSDTMDATEIGPTFRAKDGGDHDQSMINFDVGALGVKADYLYYRGTAAGGYLGVYWYNGVAATDGDFIGDFNYIDLGIGYVAGMGSRLMDVSDTIGRLEFYAVDDGATNYLTLQQGLRVTDAAGLSSVPVPGVGSLAVQGDVFGSVDGTTFVPYRKQLGANLIVYVRTDGNDSNTGLVNNAGGAFLTIDRAVDYALSLDWGATFQVQVRVGTGTFSGYYGDFKGLMPFGTGLLHVLGEGVGNTIIDTNGQGGYGWVSEIANLVVVIDSVTFDGTNYGGGSWHISCSTVGSQISVRNSQIIGLPTDVFAYVNAGKVIADGVEFTGDYLQLFYLDGAVDRCVGSLIGLSDWSAATVSSCGVYLDRGSIFSATSPSPGTFTGKSYEVIDGIILDTAPVGTVAGTVVNGYITDRHHRTAPRIVPGTYADLPGSPTLGMLAAVSDANTATWGATVSSGGGSNEVLVWYNGTNWTVVGA